MPCNTIQQTKVEVLPKNTDTGLLTQGLERLGFEVSKQDDRLILLGRDTYGDYGSGSYDATTGRLELSNDWEINEIKRSYSEQVIESQARKFGWQLQWSTNKAGHREAVVLRRG